MPKTFCASFGDKGPQIAEGHPICLWAFLHRVAAEGGAINSSCAEVPGNIMQTSGGKEGLGGGGVGTRPRYLMGGGKMQDVGGRTGGKLSFSAERFDDGLGL